MSHECPRNECQEQVPDTMLACLIHWHAIPKPLRDAVWKAWNNGKGAGTDAHHAAMTRAVEYLNREG